MPSPAAPAPLGLASRLQAQFAPFMVLVANAGLLAATTLMTSGLGFAYWWVAARFFSPSAVGLASAGIAGMTLMSLIGVLGLGTFVMGHLRADARANAVLISSALALAAAGSALFGAGYALLARATLPDVARLTDSSLGFAIFVAGVAVTGFNQVLDQSLIGLLSARLQLFRNTVFAVAKLAALVAVGVLALSDTGLAIYATWLAGGIVSIAALAWLARQQNVTLWARPRYEPLRGAGGALTAHHSLNVVDYAPGLVLPIVVTTVLSPELNASFYLSWLIANLMFLVPSHLATMLYAVGSRAPAEVPSKLRFTMAVSAAAGVVGAVFFILFGTHILALFGHSYAETAGPCMQAIALSVFAIIVRVHYVAMKRIAQEPGKAAVVLAVGGLLEVACAIIGARIAGLTGLGIGWCLANYVQIIPMIPTVLRGLRREQ
jgi:O-antigen/teichoic acid export membrane protein